MPFLQKVGHHEMQQVVEFGSIQPFPKILSYFEINP
jgi:hypothetical protein